MAEKSFFRLTPARGKRMMALVPRGKKGSEPSGKQAEPER